MVPAREVAIGQALFHAPALLGGQAERAGLSCAGCHANGRRSAAFFLDGISSKPGTADISSSFFALPRANAVFDPREIPDLALPGKVSRDPANGVLEPFLRGLVVEEFSGAEPEPAALAALAAYVRAINACPGREMVVRTMRDDLALVDRSIDGVRAMLARGESGTARVLVRAARFRLGLIQERMAGARHKALRKALEDVSRDLAPLEQQGDMARLDAWRARFDRDLTPKLLSEEKRSLYEPRTVDRWLARRR